MKRLSIYDYESWINQRKNLIQASDAAAILGMSPWQTDAHVWDAKVKGITEDISSKPCIIYGKKMEPVIRESFLIDNPYFSCEYHEFDILVSDKRPWQGCTLDGELTVETPANPWSLCFGDKGILEIKTGSFRGFKDLQNWDKIPLHYYCQILHQLSVTEWDFVIITARLKRDAYREEDKGFPQIENRSFIVKRKDCLKHIKILNQAEQEFFDSLKKGKRPTAKFSIKEMKEYGKYKFRNANQFSNWNY